MSRDISFHVALRAGPFRASGRAGAAGRKRLHPESCNNLFLSRKEAPRRCPPCPAGATPQRTGALLRTWCPAGPVPAVPRCPGSSSSGGGSCSPLAVPLALGAACGARCCGQALAEGGGGDAGGAGGTERQRCRSAAGAFPAWHGDGCGRRTLVLHPRGRAGGGRRAMPRRAGTGPWQCHRGCRAIAPLPHAWFGASVPRGAGWPRAPPWVTGARGGGGGVGSPGRRGRGVSRARAGAGSAAVDGATGVRCPARCSPGARGAAGPGGAGTGARAGPVTVPSLTVKGAGSGAALAAGCWLMAASRGALRCWD